MYRRTYLEGIGAAATIGAFAGCTGGGTDDGAGDESGDGNGDSDGNGNDGGDGNGDSDTDDGTDDDDLPAYGLLSTSVTDQPNDIGDFESLVVTIQGIWVKPAGDVDSGGSEDVNGTENDEAVNGTDSDEAVNGTEDDGSNEANDDVDENAGRYHIEFEEPQDADLVQLQGDNTQLVDETELEVGDYRFLQLDIAGTDGTLTDGEDASVETLGNAPLQFKEAFEIRPEERTRFIADFAPFRRGNGRYLIRPVASGTQVLYGDEELDDQNSEPGGGDDSEENADNDSSADGDDDS